jgi:hypothetical protein
VPAAVAAAAMPGAAAGWAPPPVADGAAPTTAALPPHESQQKVSTPCRGAQHLPSHCCRLAIPAQMACGVWWRQSECSAALSRCGAPAGCERCKRQHRCPPHPHQPGAYVHAKPGHPGQPQVRCSSETARQAGSSCCATGAPSVLGGCYSCSAFAPLYAALPPGACCSARTC